MTEPYINRLQQENAALKAQLAKAQQATTDFMTLLQGPKFTGEEPAHWDNDEWVEAEDKDWISTGDVMNWLRDHRMSLIPE